MKLKLITIILFIIALSLGGLIFYLANIRVKTITNYTTVEKKENDPTKTDEEAEKINLNNVPKKIIPINELQESIYLSDKDVNITSKILSPQILKLNSDGDIQNIASDDFKAKIKNLSNSKAIIPLIFVDKGTKVQSIEKIVESIKNEIVTNSYGGVDLDYSLVAAVSDYPKLVKDLSKITTILDKKLIISILPRWSDYVKYNYWANLSDFYTKTLDLKDLSQFVSSIRIHAYTYTTTQSSLPGQTSPLDWVEQIIQYNIKSGLPRDKIEIVINTYAYRWTDREIANSFKDNVVLTTVQVIKHTKTELSMLELMQINDESWNEKAAPVVLEGKNYIIIYPTEESINNIKKITADYGLKGYVLF